MKKIYKKISLLVFLFIMGNASFGQPGNVHYGVMGTWGDMALIDRGVTSWVSIQNPLPFGTTIAFLFNPSAGNYSPKWCGSSTDSVRVVNQKIDGGAFYYTSGGWDKNLNCAVQPSYYYTLVVGKNPTANNDMSILETSYSPVTISSVIQSPVSNIAPSAPVTVTVTLSGTKNANEKVYVRYSVDSWATSSFVEITSFNASFQGTAVIPGQTAGTTVSYYALTSNQTTAVHATIDYYTLRLNNNTNLNYSYTVTSTVGINETNKAAMDIYPNPATDLLTVKLNSPDGAVTLRLYNILGDAVMTDVLNSNGIIQKTYDVRDLPKGTYILNATLHNSSFTKKIVIY